MRRVPWRVVSVALAWTAMPAQTRPAVLEPVHWSAESRLPPASAPGSRFAVVVRASIDAGWHLYALPARNDFPLATEITLAQSGSADLLRVEQEKPHRSMDAESHVVTEWFVTSATFTLRLATTTGQPHDLQVLVRYHACNDRMCLPPRQVTVPVVFSRTR